MYTHTGSLIKWDLGFNLITGKLSRTIALCPPRDMDTSFILQRTLSRGAVRVGVAVRGGGDIDWGCVWVQ